ncbi:MAG: gamma-glutamyltransferase [Haliea sp.]|nr:gamma-glutamyltransferase [Haliea sp.]|tara:strand:+ start:58500 stop:60236 length:1737 start_codon:yes stop_codon:yes gene_type:complete
MRHRLLACCCALLITLSPATLARETAQQAPIIDYGSRFLPQVARQAMVVGPERLAAEIGLDILREGGNAVDAAVATGFALAVSYPRAGNLGGGGFMLIHLDEEDRQTFIDYRETAPAAATRDLFLDEQGEIDRQRSYFSHLSSGVPGTVAGLILAQERYGTLPLPRVLAPAIALAEEGLEVSWALQFEIAARAEQLRKNPEAARLFFKPDGSAYRMGDHWRQPELAWTLRQIAERGREGFYQGPVAERIVAEMERGGGLISEQDLADYRALEREPVRGSFQGFEVVSAPPPSSGGVHILQMLNLLEGFDLKGMGHNSAAYIHHLAEAMKLAYADRSQFLADPDFVEVPVAQLTSKSYAERQRALVDPGRATPSSEIAPGRVLVQESHDTTHYSVADRWGNVVTNTYTLNFSFGSHIAVPGTGMLLNNEMADFAARPGSSNAFGLVEHEANRIEGGKRPLSSMSPTLVLRDGEPWLATGSPGGSVIITTVLQTLLNAMVFDMNVAAAATESRVHHQWLPDRLILESGISPDTRRLLESLGHNVDTTPRTLGRTQSIMLEGGYLYGATDPRRLGGHVAGE